MLRPLILDIFYFPSLCFDYKWLQKAVSDSLAESKNTPSLSLSLSLSCSCPPISRGYLSFHSNYAEPNTEWHTDVPPPLHFYFLLWLQRGRWTSVRWAFQNPSLVLSPVLFTLSLSSPFSLFFRCPPSSSSTSCLSASVNFLFFHFCLSPRHAESLSSDTVGLAWNRDAAVRVRLLISVSVTCSSDIVGR